MDHALTAEDLDSLPELSVLIDNEGDVAQKRGGLWCYLDTRPMESKRVVKKYAPLKIIYTPEEAA